MQKQMQAQAMPKKITLRLREGVKATIVLGHTEVIDRIVSEHSNMYENNMHGNITPPPPISPEIHDKEFYECKYLIDIDIDDMCERIGAYAFCKCDNLESVVIGKGVKRICAFAFSQCGKLKQIKYTGSVQEWKAIDKSIGWKSKTGNFKVVCNDGVLARSQC